jgi:hypothetical protein
VLLPIVFFALLLMGYRWLVGHTRYPALVYGAVLLVVVAPLIVPIEPPSVGSRPAVAWIMVSHLRWTPSSSALD